VFDIVMLFRHILDRDGHEFAIVLGVIEHIARIEGMDVDLDDIVIADQDEDLPWVAKKFWNFFSMNGFLPSLGLA
jgi:hypothetical protein